MISKSLALWVGMSAATMSAAIPVAVQAAGDGLEEIIVTATRRDESLQDVPLTVTAISDEQLQKLNITQFRDIQTIAPGLVMEDRGAQGNVTALRGISTTVVTSSPQAVVMYLNEAHIEDSLAFQSIYDIGQIEVLRGPQGTLRGVAAPAGSITIATRRPDLKEIGSTADVTYTDQEAFNSTLAVNVPLIEDVLAIRVAGLYDHNQNGDVRNPATGAESKSTTKSGRASVLFQPVESLSIFGSYQYLRNETDSLTLVEGTGMGYNGPVISSGRRDLAVQEEVSPRQGTGHVANLNTKFNIGDEAVLSYIGGYFKFDQLTRATEGDNDSGNAILNYAGHALFDVSVKRWTHELRLDSAGNGRFWDYTVGAYRERTTSAADIMSPLFGVYLTPPPPAGPPAISGDLDILSSGKTVDKSIFASNTFHFSSGTDVTVGARRLWTDTDAPTSFVLVSNTFGTVTTMPVGTFPDTRDLKDWVYDAKLVQHIGEDSIIYASYGHGFRGPGSNKFVSAPEEVFTVDPEEQDSYELGFKGSLLDNRMSIGIAIFQQDIEGYISSVNDVPYCPLGSAAPCGPSTTQSSLTFNGDARVRGFDLDLFGRLTDNWTAQAAVSYAKGEFTNAQVPCRPDLNGDGVPDNNVDFGALATQSIYFCSSNEAISDVPEWNFTLQSEYAIPVGRVDAYLRGLFIYKGEREEVSGIRTYDAQPILNLYVGARNLVKDLELTLFAKNIFDTRKLTYTGSELVTLGFPSGYNQVSYTPAREIGITARFSFGGG